jgi:hypothetical protein
MMMKKKMIAGILAVILVFSFSITALAAKGPGGSGGQGGGATASAGPGGPSDQGAQLNARARIMSCLSVMTQNRAMVLNYKTQNMQIASQLRIVLQELKENGTALTEDQLATLTELKTQLKALHDQLAATRGEIEALMVTYREYKQAGDLENAAAVLDQVIEIQQLRMTLETQINALTQQILDFLRGL